MRSSLSDGVWQRLADDAWTGLAQWRQQHPKATLREIEQTVDERLASLRARLVQDAALASASADPAAGGDRPRCPDCGTPMHLEGAWIRRLRTTHERDIALTRRYARCPACGTGLFPLDEELALLPGALTPALQEGVVRLGSWLPFARAAEMLAHFTHTTIGEATARRLTEGAGAAYEAVQAAEVARIERELPDDPAGPAVQQVSVDGVLVPVLKGAWVEAKVLAIGTVTHDGAGGVARATDLSYFARHAEVAAFTRQALVEVHRRGTATAGMVVGIADGAVWCQGVYDVHCPEAVRILDFSHAQTYLVAAARAAFGPGTAAASEWLGTQCHALKHKTPEDVLAARAALPVETAPSRAEAVTAQAAAVAYLSARIEQARYAQFLAAGYPIGSGAVESAGCPLGDAGGRGAADAGGHALGHRARQPDAGLADRRLQRPLGRRLAADHRPDAPPGTIGGHDPAHRTPCRTDRRPRPHPAPAAPSRRRIRPSSPCATRWPGADLASSPVAPPRPTPGNGATAPAAPHPRPTRPPKTLTDTPHGDSWHFPGVH